MPWIKLDIGFGPVVTAFLGTALSLVCCPLFESVLRALHCWCSLPACAVISLTFICVALCLCASANVNARFCCRCGVCCGLLLRCWVRMSAWYCLAWASPLTWLPYFQVALDDPVWRQLAHYARAHAVNSWVAAAQHAGVVANTSMCVAVGRACGVRVFFRGDMRRSAARGACEVPHGYLGSQGGLGKMMTLGGTCSAL